MVHESLDAIILLSAQVVWVAKSPILRINITRVSRARMLPTSLVVLVSPVLGWLVIVGALTGLPCPILVVPSVVSSILPLALFIVVA